MTPISYCLWKSHCPWLSIVKYWNYTMQQGSGGFKEDQKEPAATECHYIFQSQTPRSWNSNWKCPLCSNTTHSRHPSPSPSSLLWHSALDGYAPHGHGLILGVCFIDDICFTKDSRKSLNLESQASVCKPCKASLGSGCQGDVLSFLMQRGTFVCLCLWPVMFKWSNKGNGD